MAITPRTVEILARVGLLNHLSNIMFELCDELGPGSYDIVDLLQTSNPELYHKALKIHGGGTPYWNRLSMKTPVDLTTIMELEVTYLVEYFIIGDKRIEVVGEELTPPGFAYIFN